MDVNFFNVKTNNWCDKLGISPVRMKELEDKIGLLSQDKELTSLAELISIIAKDCKDPNELAAAVFSYGIQVGVAHTEANCPFHQQQQGKDPVQEFFSSLMNEAETHRKSKKDIN